MHSLALHAAVIAARSTDGVRSVVGQLQVATD